MKEAVSKGQLFLFLNTCFLFIKIFYPYKIEFSIFVETNLK